MLIGVRYPFILLILLYINIFDIFLFETCNFQTQTLCTYNFRFVLLIFELKNTINIQPSKLLIQPKFRHERRRFVLYFFFHFGTIYLIKYAPNDSRFALPLLPLKSRALSTGATHNTEQTRRNRLNS